MLEPTQPIEAGAPPVPGLISEVWSPVRVAEATGTRPRYYLLAVVLILLAGFVLRVWDLGGPSLWTDEVLTQVRAEAPLTRSLDSLFNAGNQTPLYFLSLRLLPHGSEALLRLPSALLGTLGIALLVGVIARLYQRYDWALWAAALLAVNPYHVMLSRTARPYAQIFVLALLVSLCFLLLLRGHSARRVWIALGISSAMAYLTHYSSAALLVAQAALFVFFWRAYRPLLRRWIAVQALAVMPVLFWLVLLLLRPPEVGPKWVPVPVLKDLLLTLWNMALGYDGRLDWFLVPALFVVSLGLPLGLIAAVRERRTRPQDFYWLWLILVPLLPVFLLSHFVISFYVDRYFMVFLPALIVLIVQGCQRLPRPLASLALSLLVLTSAHNVITFFYRGEYQREDWRAAGAYVAQAYQPGDTVLVERANIRLTFERYYQRFSPVPPELMLPSAAEVRLLAGQAPARVWVIYRNPIEDVHRQGLMPDFDPFLPGQSAVGDWLIAHREQIAAQRAFNGMRVFLVVLEGTPPVAGP